MSEQKQEFKHIVRVANTDLDGNKPIQQALLKIKGIGFSLANAVCQYAKVEGNKKTGYLLDDETEQLTDVLQNPHSYKMPSWMLNRQKDVETGEDMHLLGPSLKFQKDNDIKLLKKIKCFKGVRHQAGLPLRGQRTGSNFRSKRGTSLGVKKKTK
ncbi:30S ribosomal protein S13 [Candidatus Woesearchaeota archaeon]|jgi:small subunit ribosomal protein S13|nr:30S ribosomal protein S13 [Candidatus Woesearchaeota archaeon]